MFEIDELWGLGSLDCALFGSNVDFGILSGISSKKTPQTSQPSETMTLRARVFTNVRRVFYIIFF
jgi:hypothetical protein